MKMEDYEIFCKKHLTRIQEEAIKTETSFIVQHKNISFIQFHGVPVLSPLLNFEKKKEIEQYKQKALDLETWRQNSKKRALLNRVQEILENVQIRKGSGANGVNMGEGENMCPASDSKALTDLTAPSDANLPCSPKQHGPTELEKTPELMSSDTVGQVTSNVTEVVQAAEENVFSEQSESCFSKDIPCPRPASPDSTQSKLASHALQKQEESAVPSSDKEVQDPYVMSLQNLLKKSREYVEKEQTRRGSKSNSKRSMSESHSDKENDAVKTTDSVKERAKLTGRNSTAVPLDKPSLNKSNTLLQGTSAHSNNTSMSTLSSFSKVDIPMRVGTPPLVDSDSDEELKNTSVVDRDSSIVRSLMGSYTKLPSPEPSMSPKMHRRRPRPLSMGHIVINNPVNAYELSPKGKGRAMDLIMQDIADKNNVSESVPKFMVDFSMLCPSRVPGVIKNSAAPCDGLVGKPNRHSFGPLESKGPLSATAEGQVAMDSRGLYKVETAANTAAPKLNEPFAISQSTVTQKLLAVHETKPSSLLENTKCNSPVELNKSYDVENPSPLLTQGKNMRQQMDTPSVSPANEQFLENTFEKVKRRLDLDNDNCQKENSSCGVTVGMEEQEKQWLQEQKYSVGSVYITKNTAPDSSIVKEEILKTKMLAFEEMRKRLEEQHAQQLSILIAEQEREQEKLQKELEEQERKLKGKKVATTEIEISKVNINSRMELEWRKSESGLLESVQSQLETVHNTNSTSIGFAHTTTPNTFTSTSETSFYLWGPSGSGVIKTSVSRPSNRIKTRWTQVFSPEIQMKFSKITAVAKGFLTRRLLQTEKLKHLKQTVKDTMDFIRNFQSEAPLKRGSVSAQDASLHERVMAQLRAALYDIHDIFFTMEASERMNILRHDREVRKEKMLRQMDKVKSPRERATLSTATQKSLDRKKYMKASEMGMPSKKIIIKQKSPESRVLQPNQGQNAPVHRLLCRQGTPKTSMKGVDQNRKKASESRVSNKAVPAHAHFAPEPENDSSLGVAMRSEQMQQKRGAYAGRTQRKKPNVVTI